MAFLALGLSLFVWWVDILNAIKAVDVKSLNRGKLKTRENRKYTYPVKTEILQNNPCYITRVTWLAFTQPQSRILGQHWVLKSVNSVLSPAFGNSFQIFVTRWVFVVT